MPHGGGGGLARVLVLAFCVAGIWSAYITQGVLQETLTTLKFLRDCTVFLKFLNAIVNVVFCWLLVMNVCDIGLAKSSKMIPVMLMGTFLYGIKYTLPEYFCTLLVAGGVSSFALLKTSPKTMCKLAHPNAPLGYGLCFMNLAFDVFTNATQDSLTERYPKTTAWDIMLGMILGGTIYNVIYMFGWPMEVVLRQWHSAGSTQRRHGTSLFTASLGPLARTSSSSPSAALGPWPTRLSPLPGSLSASWPPHC